MKEQGFQVPIIRQANPRMKLIHNDANLIQLHQFNDQLRNGMNIKKESNRDIYKDLKSAYDLMDMTVDHSNNQAN